MRLGWFLIVATIPIGILGFLFRDQIETGARNLWLIGTMLIVFALVLGYADRLGRHEREIDQLSPRDGVLIGLAQSLSLIPGVSRSGATMSAGLLLGLQRPAAARFAFLLAVPAVVASGLFELKDVITGDEHSTTPLGLRAGRHARRVRRRLRRDRVAAALPRAPLREYLRRLPRPARQYRSHPRGHRSDQLMAKLFEDIDDKLRAFIERQPMFFVATAPSGDGGHVNLSPKGGDNLFQVTGPLGFAYVDLMGSGIETIAHLRENGRICVMFCAFDGRAEDRAPARHRHTDPAGRRRVRRGARARSTSPTSSATPCAR